MVRSFTEPPSTMRMGSVTTTSDVFSAKVGMAATQRELSIKNESKVAREQPDITTGPNRYSQIYNQNPFLQPSRVFKIG